MFVTEQCHLVFADQNYSTKMFQIYFFLLFLECVTANMLFSQFGFEGFSTMEVYVDVCTCMPAPMIGISWST